jgi:hypothetical protein
LSKVVSEIKRSLLVAPILPHSVDVHETLGDFWQAPSPTSAVEIAKRHDRAVVPFVSLGAVDTAAANRRVVATKFIDFGAGDAR